MGSSVASTASRWSASSAALLLVAALATACASTRTPAEGEGAAELPFYATPDFTAIWHSPGSRDDRAIHRVAPFSFVDQDGQEVTDASLRGKIYVANFFFTSCPAICPRMTASLTLIQDAFADDPDVLLVSHTVDPESDTPERLSSYARAHRIKSGKWHLVTGDQATIYTLARTSYFAEKELGVKKGTNEFLHTENMLLVDRRGHLRGVYNATLPAEARRVIEDIRLLSAER
jgi:protein SCO1/2